MEWGWSDNCSLQAVSANYGLGPGLSTSQAFSGLVSSALRGRYCRYHHVANEKTKVTQK